MLFRQHPGALGKFPGGGHDAVGMCLRLSHGAAAVYLRKSLGGKFAQLTRSHACKFLYLDCIDQAVIQFICKYTGLFCKTFSMLTEVFHGKSETHGAAVTEDDTDCSIFYFGVQTLPVKVGDKFRCCHDTAPFGSENSVEAFLGALSSLYYRISGHGTQMTGEKWIKKGHSGILSADTSA